MSGCFYLNPSTLLIRNEGRYEIRIGPFPPILLNEEEHGEFIKNFSTAKEYSLEKILEYFTVDEAFDLFRRNAFIDREIDMSDRYSRMDCFFSLEGNDGALKTLAGKNVLVLGAGGVATHIVWMYAALGVGKMTLLDFDVVELSNLNRQLLYEEGDVGRNKIEALADHINRINSDVELELLDVRVKSGEQLDEIIGAKPYDLVVAAIDTPLAVRHWINEACVKHKVPYVTGAFGNNRGIVGITYIPNETPCFDCMQDQNVRNIERVAGSAGATLPLIAEFTASKVATEGVNILLGRNEPAYAGKYEVFDYQTNLTEVAEMTLRPQCPVCGRKNADERKLDLSLINYIYYFICAAAPLVIHAYPKYMYIPIIALVAVNALLLIGRRYDNVYETAFCGALILSFSALLVFLAVTPQLNAINYVARILFVTFFFLFFICLCSLAFISNVFLGERFIDRLRNRRGSKRA